MNTKTLGSWGEKKAAAFYRRKWYRIREMNYSCRFGEIDVIAENRHFIVFAEVKLRKSADFAQAMEFVTPAKQNRVRTTAQLWLACHPTEKQPRFDVIEIYASRGAGKKYTINQIENAF